LAQVGGLQRRAGGLAGQLGPGALAEFVIDQRQESFRGAPLAPADLLKDARDFVHPG